MIRLRFLLMLAVASLLMPFSYAQSSTRPHQHSASASGVVVDGAVHPELIPDSIAYRLYFLAVSTGVSASDEDRKQKQLYLRKASLEEGDLNALTSTLTEFRTKFDSVVAQYNQSATAATARNEAPDIHGFLRQIDGLVQSTRNTLKARLSPQGMTQFDAFVRSEKTHMKVHGEEGQ
jgi:hypothetical protein